MFTECFRDGLLATALVAAVTLFAAEGKKPSVAAKPISADAGPVGDLLRRWAAEGTAAGNNGDWYDNRDGDHSPLNLTPHPQLQRVAYSEEDKKQQRHWSLQRDVLPRVVFGNSSTSAPATAAGSNARTAYCSADGLPLLARQYRANNLYIYPEHQDHDPARAGEEGYGDLFPTNTPYVIISQGSSGSDQPFLQALPPTLAAFRPDVKARLVENGLLMPTVQMILRMSSKRIREPGDYLTAKAHPTVFDGQQVDTLKMVQLAHEIMPADIPPMVQLRLIESDTAHAGRDYFDNAPSESLAETECVIARIFRSMKSRRRLVVSAEQSFDLNKRPLTFHWVLLRGDSALVNIKPLNGAKSRAEITFRYHERAPIAAGEALTSNRVDIGVFVHNGRHYSAPGFVTSFTLDSEARTYDAEGRILEAGYGFGRSALNISDWTKFIDALTAEPQSPGPRLLREKLTAGQRKAIGALGREFKATAARASQRDKEKRDAEEALKQAGQHNKAALEAAAKAAGEAAAKAAKDHTDVLEQRPGGFPAPLKEHLATVLRELMEAPTLYPDHAAEFAPMTTATGKRLAALGIVKESNSELLPLHSGDGPPETRLSRYQRAQLARVQGELLETTIPGLKFDYRRNLVDFRLTLPKAWRDVYRYTEGGTLLGWMRFDEVHGTTEFTTDGVIVLTRDALGRCATAATVSYRIPDEAAKRPPWEWPPLTFSAQLGIVRYQYESDGDRFGRLIRTELPAPAGSK